MFDKWLIEAATDDFKERVFKNVDIQEYHVVPVEDREPVSVIQPNLQTGPWIAGGACLRWYQGMPVAESDIDIFCRDALQSAEVIDRIKSYGRYGVKFQSENAMTFEYWPEGDYSRRWTLQVITRRYFKNLQEIIDNFDITVCQVGTAGNEWLIGDKTAKDIREKNLRFKKPLQPDAAKRLLKYWVYGYRPVDNVVQDICNNPESRWAFKTDEDYNNAF